MKRFFLWLIALMLIAPPLSAAEWTKVTPGRQWVFPRDHGAHPEFKTEWWYFTGHAADGAGKNYGFQWTVFRISLAPPAETAPANASPWRARDIYFAHLALSDLSAKKFYFGESQARGAAKLAESSSEKFFTRLPGFSGASQDSTWTLKGEAGGIGVDLTLSVPEEVWFQGKDGYSSKSNEEGHASYYYSYPHLPLSGKLKIGKSAVEVKGEAWFDHEFSSYQLSSNQVGWDWFSLPFPDGSALMLFRLRDKRGADQDFFSGAWRDPSGKVQGLKRGDFSMTPLTWWQSPLSGGKYPVAWTIRIASLGAELKVGADFFEQELDTRKTTQVTYWEGSVSVSGTLLGKPVETKGYLELTGYSKNFEKGI